MKIESFRNSDAAYQSTLKEILDTKEEVVDAGNSTAAGKSVGSNMKSREILNYSIAVAQPNERLIYNKEKKLNLPNAVARFVWMMAGSDRLYDIAFYEPKVKYFSDDNISVPGSNYGQRMLQPRPGLNQLKAVIKRIEENATTRRAAISIYHPEDAVRQSNDIPCTFGLFYHVREDKLHATTIMRSNNAYILMPYNLFEFSMLADVVSAELKVNLGTLTHTAVSMHVYERDYKAAEKIVRAEVPSGPQPIPVPRDNPLEQINKLVQLEAELRHAAAGLDRTNVKEWIKKSTTLNEYWSEIYKLLLLHMVYKGIDGDAKDQVYSSLSSPYSNYVSAPDHENRKKLTGTEETLFGDEVVPEVIPLYSTKTMLSLRRCAEDYEKSGKGNIDWRTFSAIQDKFMSKIAARGSDMEVSIEDFEKSIALIRGRDDK